ncbi:hypothetical protein [Enterococcus gilvus]|uniref:hypothetical protein n=1 Tax=Enterococcus gilvus TaxID=160453 RepID=UPI00345E5663
MKKWIGIISLLLVVILFSGCSQRKDINKYVGVTFYGINTKGTANYTVDTNKMVKEILKFDLNDSNLSKKQTQEADDLLSAISIQLTKDTDLSNGDTSTIKIKVDEDKTKKIRSSEKKVEVTGLKNPKKLTNKDVEKKIVINFDGVSGRGNVKIDNVFDAPLDTLNFEVKNDGNLKNGDKAEIYLPKDEQKNLESFGYVLPKNFSPTVEVSGLNEVAASAKDISNLEDIKRMIDEEVKRTYKDSGAEYSFGSKYEITLDKLMYRQFDKENSKEQDDIWGTSNSDQNGNLIGIYTIKRYSGGTESKLEETKTAIIGYSNIVLDENKAANVAELDEIETTKDDTYSLESVLKLYEGYGYKPVD